MEQIQENEQWKLSGNCEKCRRSNYCSTPCTQHNRRKRSIASTFCNQLSSAIIVSHYTQSKKFST